MNEKRAGQGNQQPDSVAVECPMCGGTGGWPGVNGWVVCRPCKGTGTTRPEVKGEL